MKYLYNVFQNIKNLIIWFPTIWKDRQFDYQYFLFILSKKLKLMSEMEESVSKNHYKNQKKMRIAYLLTLRLLKDNYFEVFEYVVDPCNFTSRVTLKTPETKFPKRFCDLLEYDNYMKQQDLNLLTTILSKHLLNWWD